MTPGDLRWYRVSVCGKDGVPAFVDAPVTVVRVEVDELGQPSKVLVRFGDSWAAKIGEPERWVPARGLSTTPGL